GYPAAPPYDGQTLYRCQDRPGRLSIEASDPTMYRIGCSMTAGSSGGGWVATGSDGKPALVSNTSIGPVTSGWLAGPRLGDEAKGVYAVVGERFAGRGPGCRARVPSRTRARPGTAVRRARRTEPARARPAPADAPAARRPGHRTHRHGIHRFQRGVHAP